MSLASQLLHVIKNRLEQFPQVEKVIFSIDAPLQAIYRPQLPARKPIPGKGEVERRACENLFDFFGKRLDRNAGGSKGWNPNVQAGAPLPPRIKVFVEGLRRLGFELWSSSIGHK